VAIRPLPTSDGADRMPRPVKEPLERLMRSMGAPATDVVATVFDRWPELVGPQVAAHSKPIALRSGTLVIAVDDPAWASQLGWLESKLLEQLNDALDEGQVSAIEVRVRPPVTGS
jgi:predicted nucleic acid-binding Zn ribbon protein